MSLIQITPDSLRVQARTVRNYKVQQEQNIQRIRNIVLSLNDSWKGAAQDAFVAKFQSMDHTYRRFSDVLEEYAMLMETAANDFQNTDQNMRNLIQNIG